MLDNFQCRGVLLIWIIVRHGPTVVAADTAGCCLDIVFSAVLYFFFFPSLSVFSQCLGWTVLCESGLPAGIQP